MWPVTRARHNIDGLDAHCDTKDLIYMEACSQLTKKMMIENESQEKT